MVERVKTLKPDTSEARDAAARRGLYRKKLADRKPADERWIQTECAKAATDSEPEVVVARQRMGGR